MSGLLKGVLAACALAWTAGEAAPARGPYEPRPVAPVRGLPCVASDGSIRIVGSERLRGLLTRLDALFSRTHPGFTFELVLRDSSVVAVQALIAGVSAFAPLEREIWDDRVEARPFIQLHGHPPADIRFGRVGYVGSPGARPPGIYVNGRNPVGRLTLRQVARIFTTGDEQGDLSHWGQLGATGEWAEHAIHPYGPRDDGWWVTTLRLTRLEGLPFSRRYEALSNEAGLIPAVAADRYAIAIVRSYNPGGRRDPVRMLPLSEREGEPVSDGTYGEVAAGRYPLSAYLHLYADRPPGGPLGPFVKEYARMILSREGQEIVAGETKTENGFVPLTAAEAERELRALE